jgi:hypothetical protein
MTYRLRSHRYENQILNNPQSFFNTTKIKKPLKFKSRGSIFHSSPQLFATTLSQNQFQSIIPRSTIKSIIHDQNFPHRKVWISKVKNNFNSIFPFSRIWISKICLEIQKEKCQLEKPQIKLKVKIISMWKIPLGKAHIQIDIFGK